MSPTDAQFWECLMLVIGPLSQQQRTLAVAYVLQTVRGRDEMDDVMVSRLIEDLRQRFGTEGESTWH